MIKQNIYIINFDLLYEILDEIKENLPFKVLKYENEDKFINNLDLKNALIILNPNQKTTLNQILDKKNLLSLNTLPLALNRLIELINIQLIKLKFNHQSKINIRNYQLDLNSKFFSKGQVNFKLTEKEIEIILYLDKTKVKHNVLDLQKKIWGYSPGMETHTVETHIYRLRKKISDKFKDENFILSDENGYFIN